MTGLAIALVNTLAEFNGHVQLCSEMPEYRDYLSGVGFIRDCLAKLVEKMGQEGQVDHATAVAIAVAAAAAHGSSAARMEINRLSRIQELIASRKATLNPDNDEEDRQ